MIIVANLAPETEDSRKLPVKARQTLVLSRGAYTREELAFAEKEGTDRLETRYVQLRRARSESFTTPEGGSFRSAGSLCIRTCRDGVRRFVAYMHDDSVHHDFRYLESVITDARFGRMDGWERYTFKDGDQGWTFDYPNYQIDRLKEFKPAVIIDESGWGYPCNEPRCRETHHRNDESASHTLESVECELGRYGGYEIEICKDAEKPDSEWYLNVWVQGELSELTPAQVSKLANDLNWMSIECQTTNAKEVAK